MDVSILVVNWNTCEHLRRCLRSVTETVRGISYETIVVDNASHDGSASMVSREFPEFILIKSEENLGFARGNNLAYSRSSGKYLLLMNPDVILLEDTVKGLIAFADEHPDAGVVSPKLLNPDNSPQNYYGRIPTLSSVLFIHTRIGSWIDFHVLGKRIRRRDRYARYGDFTHPLPFTDGGAAFCCSLIPRSIIETIGFLDERFPVFFNDGDFGMRLFRAGYKAYMIPHVKAHHFGGSSIKQLDRLTYDKEWLYGLRTFCRKHKGSLYNIAIDTVLSINLVHDLVLVTRDILLRKKYTSQLFEPVRAFKEMLTYTPPNARLR